MTAHRCAIYFAPEEDSALFAFGRDWLGRDPRAPDALPQPTVDGIAPDALRAMTDPPRRYGFHGTLKAPFRLADGASRDGLIDAADAFARRTAPIDAPTLKLARLGRFLALIPSAPCEALQSFAADCVRAFEPFRAPLSDAEIARRRQSALTPAQDALMLQWGYPYVFDEFRFHLTVSGSLDTDSLDRLEPVLHPMTAPLCTAPFTVRSVCLFEEPEPGAPFLLTARWPLGGA